MPPLPTVNAGSTVRSTMVGLEQTRRVVDMRDRLYLYDPAKSPFLTILSERAPAVRADNPVFNHLEDQQLPWWDTLGAALASTTATTFTATNGAYFRPGDVLLIASSTLAGGEYLKVTNVSGNTVTVVRNYTGDLTTGGTALIGAYVAIIGNVNAENSGTRWIKSTIENPIQNYTQILKSPFGASNTLDASRLYGGGERPYQRRKNAAQHAFEVERAFLFGKKQQTNLGTAGAHYERTTGGLLSWIQTNVLNVGGTLTDQILETWTETLFRYGSQTRLVLAGRRFASQLDMIAAGRLQTDVGANTYGVKVNRFMSSHGNLLVTISDMLINDYAGYAIAIDMDNVMKRYLSDDDGARDARLVTNIQQPDTDGWLDQYLSEVGLHVVQESTHGVLKGIS